MVLAAAALFALGLATGATVRLSLTQRAVASAGPALLAERDGEPAPPETPIAHRLDPAIVYPAEVLRIIDGDTFEVRVWPGLDVDTKIRLRGVDAAELHARCADELAKAQAARVALQTILADGGVAISRVGVDKYGGRVDAAVSTRRLCAQLRWRKARDLVRVTGVSNQRSVIRRTDSAPRFSF